MKKLLLIMGDLATGKSTFANILSERYSAHIFCKDSIKEVLGDTIGFSNREENLKLSRATMELMFFIFKEFGKLSENLILESNFHTAELENLHTIAAKNDYEVLTLVLRGKVEILHKRYLNRMHNENRHLVHLSTSLDDFTYQTDENILGKIDEFMKD